MAVSEIEQQLRRQVKSESGGYTRLLYINPSGALSVDPVDDELTAAMEAAFADAKTIQVWRGYHICVCGEKSSNRDYEVAGKYQTNSLCVHYLRWHRSSVPASELDKVRPLAQERKPLLRRLLGR